MGCAENLQSCDPLFALEPPDSRDLVTVCQNFVFLAHPEFRKLVPLRPECKGL